MPDRDDIYLETILEPILACAKYRPKMGKDRKGGLDLQAFQELYRNDSFYRWMGLDSPLLYAAHKAAGGMTSVYRQIGIGCERLFRRVLADQLALSEEESNWSYKASTTDGRVRTLRLDARIPIDSVDDEERRAIVRDWLRRAAEDLGVADSVKEGLTGAVFEVRQGYKSRDSKRQNADIANAASAYVNTYLPCVCVLSDQIDEGIETRYSMEKWAILTGTAGTDDDLRSVYAFMRRVVGYDLAAFFERKSPDLRAALDRILRALLKAK